MSIDQKFPKLAPWSQQTCPLCGDEKIIIAHGITIDKEDKVRFYPDRGYSFCNCKSIWFTDWSNIDQRVRHENDSTEVLRHYILTGRIRNKGYEKNYFQCLGWGDPVKAEAKRLGFEVCGKAFYDFIWAYHVFEHSQNPLHLLSDTYDNLSPEGLLFIAMPDPYFIDFENPYSWKHWLLREHYIMWDMDSFCDELEKVGFKILLKRRNTRVKLKKDYHIICQK